MKYRIKFNFPDGLPVWAGEYQGAAGFAAKPNATIFPSREVAEATLKNGYGPYSQEYGAIEEVDDEQ